jgi:DNA-binding XRE family transcriptional regulator
MPKPLTPEQLTALRAVPVGTLANRLRIALALAGVNQTEVAKEIGLPVPNLNRHVNGRHGGPTIETGRKLAEYFGCSIEDLFPARVA